VPEIAIRNGTALVGENLEPFEQGEILIAGGRIVSITDNALASTAHVVDASGGFVLPGLIDSHVHLSLPGGPESVRAQLDRPSVRLLAAFVNGLTALSQGVTSVRDLAAVDHTVIDYAHALGQERGIRPRVVAAGKPIVMTGGHAWELAEEVNGADAVRQAARAQIKAGARVIKMMATGGFSTETSPGAPELTLEELRAGADVAHRAGFLAAAHAHGAEGIAAAVDAGVDSIEHGAYITSELCQVMRERNTALVPTLVSMERVVAGAGVPDFIVEKCIEEREIYYDNIGRAIRTGVTIAAGTDAGSELNPFRDALLEELHLYTRLGMSLVDSLRTATVAAGRLIGPGVGQLAEGAQADVIVVDDDPRLNLDVLREPKEVLCAGVHVDLNWVRASIDGLSWLVGRSVKPSFAS
jgi:imidazolonepropionase-like amidohydrolase